MMMLVVLVSAGWSWLLSPCVGVEAGGAGVAAGGGAGVAAGMNIRTYVTGHCLAQGYRRPSAALQFCLI